MGIRGSIRQILTARCERRYDRELKSKRLTYKEWLEQKQEDLWEQEAAALSAAAPSSAAASSADVLILQASEGVLARNALELICRFFQSNPQAVLAYGDEDVSDPVTKAGRDPWFKPDWSPDTFLEYLYWGSITAVRRDWFQGLEPEPFFNREEAGEDIPDNGSARACVRKLSRRRYGELTASLAAAAGGFERSCEKIGHIPEILFRGEDKACQEGWDAVSMKEPMPHAGGRPQEPGRLQEQGMPMISVIIPSKDHPDLLARCLDALYGVMGDCRCQVLVVDNGSREENRVQIEALLQKAPVSAGYFYQPMEFNFSKMCNLGAQHAQGELLLFLNDDVELCCQGFLEKMAKKAMEPYAGAVGVKLYYPGSIRIQHAGIVNLPMGPVHKLQFLTDDRDYYDRYNRTDRNVLAVTGACLMVQKEKFYQAEGFSEALKVAFNDVELCFHLRELGYSNVVLNSIYAYHHESLSRGEDESREKLQRLMSERELLNRLHPGFRGRDPYYPEGLNRDCLDTGIRPAYVTAGNRIQQPAWRAGRLNLNGYRRDDCLLLRIERCDEECIQGYGVVLGDNNACYDKRLLLWRLKEASDGIPSGQTECLYVKPAGQYRPDLEQNMADQSHVALCGFWLDRTGEGIPTGEYLLGMTAQSLKDGTRLVNWSSRILKVGEKAGKVLTEKARREGLETGWRKKADKCR